ncbi:hypothetical protein [Halostagnicola kamekurae]|uniref:Uncharacterized protein n=1 Tax=Halostagnicola kamekurae TaxID=619731 RepID=A0A1I6QPJ6_9EURY|nr:hypothetical protein [Halostagnicola kamekurae]SFS54324.1 hypothetical protein SAMN04488556_1425 [Halostagnicola kamekurae]
MELVVNVDLDEGSVVLVEEVLTADTVQKIDLNATSVTVDEDDSEIDFESGNKTADTGTDDPIEIASDELSVTNLNETEYTISVASESEF